MIDPQFCSDHEQHSVQPQRCELQLLHQHKPNSQIPNEFEDRSSTYSIWKKPKSSYPDVSSEITHSSTKKRPSGELSCELGLAISENPRRVCRICFRHFSSGRALGGHMRVHGPLFQPAGTKRKLNFVETKDSEDRRGIGIVDSKHGDLSLLSKSIFDKEVGKVEDGVISSFSESEGEAIEDANASEANVHQTGSLKDFDDEDDEDDGIGEYYGFTDHHLDSSKKNPLYQLRHNPKRSRRFANDDFAMEMLLSGQGANVKGSLERSRVCSECGKAFWSWKALFGHMRCHPEREWRGILPPEDSSVHEGQRFSGRKPFAKRSFVESSEYELESDVEDKDYYTEAGGEKHSHEIREDEIAEKALQMVEEEEVTEEELAVMRSGIGDGETYVGEDSKEWAKSTARGIDWNPRWPTAGKRSRRKSTEGKTESLQQVNSYPHEEEPALTSESTSLVELGEETHIETPNFLFMLAEAAKKIEQDTQVRESLLQLCPDVPHFSSKLVKEQDDIGPFNAKQSLAATSSASGINVKYECSTCKKSFNSHQALGGHRASHRKMKGCFARTTLGDEMVFGARDELTLNDAWQVQEKEPLHLVDKEKKQQQTKGHECSICHRMFSTGQALGGHKRCHYSSEKVAEAVSVTSSNKQLYEEGHSSKLDEGGSILDLNMPAPDEEGEVMCASAELRLFHGKLDDERKATCTTKSNQEGLSLASWTKKDILGGQNNSSWELEGRWAMGPAVAY